jgi:precorrin-6A/cobalt-precorrin-6A reductase
MRLLILGGTTESSALARRIADRHDLQPVLSLAGRTRNPAPPPIPFRAGGFGGISGLESYLRQHAIDAVIDATHPFAAQMSGNAGAACRNLRIPIACFTRPPWRRHPADRWTEVPDIPTAVQTIGHRPRRAFLTVGGVHLAEFQTAPHHWYLVRTIDPPDAIPPSHRLILARFPFSETDEIALMRAEKIDTLVTKNSGGAATEAKIAAARALNIEVIMIQRPPPEDHPTFHRLDDILAWIEAHRPPQ